MEHFVGIRQFLCLFFSQNNKKPHPKMWFNGAVEQIRTADLVITNDVLCRLSYNSMVSIDNL